MGFFGLFFHLISFLPILSSKIKVMDKISQKLGSVTSPVIQANGRLTFEDDLRSGGLLYCVSQ